MNPFANGVLPDTRFVQLNKAEIAFLLHIYDSHPQIRCASQVRINSVFNGGVTIARKNKETKSRNVSQSDVNIPNEEQEWLNQHNLEHCIADYRLQSSLGVSVTTSVFDNGKIRLTHLDLTQVDLEFYRDPSGIIIWKVYYSLASQGMYSTPGHSRNYLGSSYQDRDNMGRIEITDVEVCVTNMPNPDGSLNSIIKCLLPDIMYEKAQLKYANQADRLRAMSTLVTEKPDDPAAKYAQYLNKSKFNGDGNKDDIRNGSSEQSHRSVKLQPRPGLSDVQMQLLNNVNQLTNGKDAVALMDDQLQQFFSKTAQSAFQSTVQLEQGRKVAKHTMPEGPANHVEFRAALRERIFALFEIPVNMIDGKSNSSSASAGGVSGAGSSGPAKEGSSGAANVQTIYKNAQRMLQRRSIDFMKRWYARFYGLHDQVRSVKRIHERENKRATQEERAYEKEAKEEEEKEKAGGDKKGKKRKFRFYSQFPDAEDLLSELEVEPVVNTLPDVKSLWQYYVGGILKYRPMIEYIAREEIIPIEFLNEEPQLDLLQLNGIQEPEPAEPKSKKK